jgi:hypothetical protein
VSVELVGAKTLFIASLTLTVVGAAVGAVEVFDAAVTAADRRLNEA